MLSLIKKYYNTPIFHGTTKYNALEIKKSKEFKFKKRPDHWLGDGIYFFVNDYKAAAWWSRNSCRRYSEIHGAVLSFILKMKISELLDLDSYEGCSRLNKFIKALREVHSNIGLSKSDRMYIRRYPKRKQLILRSKYIKLYCAYHTNIKAIKYTFTIPVTLKSLKIIDLCGHEIQINIIDNSLINFKTCKLHKVEVI